MGSIAESASWIGRFIANAISSRSSSTDSNDFEPSRLAMRRPRATISRWSSSLVRGCGFAEAKLGVRAAGDSSEAARPSEASGVAGGGKGPRASAASVRARAPASRDRGQRPRLARALLSFLTSLPVA
jgi:hypothetical protein